MLFGAGASRFCGGGVSPYEPPLGPDLFPELEKFNPFFARLNGRLKSEFRSNFEHGMELFTQQHNEDIQLFLCHMSLYFLQFAISDSRRNFYSRFVEFIKLHRLPINFATLNYDLLLEQAIIAAKLQNIATWDQSLKLHGSPNYLVGELTDMMNFRNAYASGATGANVVAPVTVRDPTTARAYCEKSLALRNALAPAISVYAKGKRVYYSPDFVRQRQAIFRDAVASAESILLVGVNIYMDDDHIWSPIASSNARIGVVNPRFDLAEEWATENGRKVTRIAGKATELVDSEPHKAALLRFIDGT